MRHGREWTVADVVNGMANVVVCVTVHLDDTSHLRMTYTVGTYWPVQSSPRQHGEHM